MKLRKIGAAFIASAVMMTSAAVVAYADETTAATENAATDALTASGLTQAQVVELIKTATAAKSREEIAAFIGTLESAKPVLEGFELDTIGDEDLGTVLALITPEDLAAFTAWLAAGDLDAVSADDLGSLDLDELDLDDLSLEDLDNLDLDAIGLDEEANALVDQLLGAQEDSFNDLIVSGTAAKILEMSNEEVKAFCKSLISSLKKEDVAAFMMAMGAADENTIAMFNSFSDEEIAAVIDTLTDEDIEGFKAMLAASLAEATATTGDVDAATDSSKGSPDTGIADVAAVAGLAVLALGGVMVAKKRK